MTHYLITSDRGTTIEIEADRADDMHDYIEFYAATTRVARIIRANTFAILEQP